MMYDFKIIYKETDEKVTELLREELNKKTIDPFKVTALIELGADAFMTIDNKALLQIAAEQQMHAVIESVLIRATDENQAVVWQTFEYCNQIKDNAALKIFLNTNVIHVYRKENNSTTALMVAVKFGNLKFTKELLKAKANMHAVDQNNQSVLDYAIMGGHSDVIQHIKHILNKDKERKQKLKEKLLASA